MFSSIPNTKTVRVATTGLIGAFLAVCSVSLAPGSAAATPTAASSAQHSAVMTSLSGQSIQDDGFHW
jgi:hypothetical protein